MNAAFIALGAVFIALGAGAFVRARQVVDAKAAQGSRVAGAMFLFAGAAFMVAGAMSRDG
jgi:multisubunit Na+/H+ antiporter MnhG subunit